MDMINLIEIATKLFIRDVEEDGMLAEAIRLGGIPMNVDTDDDTINGIIDWIKSKTEKAI